MQLYKMDIECIEGSVLVYKCSGVNGACHFQHGANCATYIFGYIPRGDVYNLLMVSKLYIPFQQLIGCAWHGL